jgi:tetratricopeptide (TPR) repeat protein
LDAGTVSQVPDEADTLYRDRENRASAERAAVIWSERLDRNPKDFEAAWKLSRARYWLGTHGLPASEHRRALEAGITAARTAATMEPKRPEGHFWLAANMGALADGFGLRQGLKYRKPIKEAIEAVLAIDPAFQDGSADRALGRWYFKVPGMFGGSTRKAEEHLRKSLTYNDQSIISRIFLAELLAADDRVEEAREQLTLALAAPLDEDFAPEDRRFKAQAQALMATLKK